MRCKFPFFKSIPVLILGFGAATAVAQEMPPKNITELKLRLETQMQKQHIAGMMFTIVQKDSVLFTGGLGYSDPDKKTPVNDTTLFRGASITKLFVSLGILNLVNEGKLSLDSRLKDLAPEVPFQNKWEHDNPVTISELMEHTTGFTDKSPFEEYNFSRKEHPGIQAINVFRDFMVSRWRPGEKHAYSGVNYAILDYIIEKISNKPTGGYLREKVFTPLGMPYANVALTADDSGRFSKGYVWKDGQYQLVPHQPAFNSGYSSLNISALDFSGALKWYLKNWQIPNGTFLSGKMLNKSETPHTYLSARAGLTNSYGFGNEAFDLDGHVFRGHKGAIGGFLSAFLYNRTLGWGYGFALNTHNEAFFQYADQLIAAFILQQVEKKDAISTYPVNRSAAAPFLGYYRLSNPGQLYTGFLECLTNTIHVEAAGNSLAVQIIGRGAMLWEAVDKTGLRYKDKYAANPRIVFLRDNDDRPLIADGTMVFEKTTAFWAWGPVLLFACSVFILFTTVIFGLINILLIALKKAPQSQAMVRILPATSAVMLLIIIWAGARLFDHMKEATPVNDLFIIWFLAKWLFLLLVLCSVSLLVYNWKYIKGKVIRIYLSCVALASCYLGVIFMLNHWYF